MHIRELKSVGHHVDTVTGYIYPSFKEGGFQTYGTHLADIEDDITWDKHLSNEDRVILNECPKIAMDVTDGLDIGYVLEWIENHLGDVDEGTVIASLGRMDMTGENISTVLDQWHIMNQSLDVNPTLEEDMLSLTGVVSYRHLVDVLSNEIAGYRGESTEIPYGIAMTICFPHGADEKTLRAWCNALPEIPTDQHGHIISHFYRIKASMTN
jgi:hypothetical protein